MSWWVFYCPLTLLPHINTRDCLEVCAIMKLSREFKKKCGSAHEKYFVKTYEDVIANQE